MTKEEFESAVDEFRSRLGQLIDEFHELTGPSAQMRAFPEEFTDWSMEEIEHFSEAQVIGWALIIEAHDTMATRSDSHIRILRPALQAPAHTVGIIEMARVQQ